MSLLQPFRQLRYLACLFMVFIFLQGCRSKKQLVYDGSTKELTTKKIIDSHYANSLDFDTLVGRVKADHDDGESQQGVSLSFRMVKDEAIWVSAPLGIFKALVTPKRVTYYNKLEKEYFDGDFRVLSEMLGTELDFQKVQNLILGEALLKLDKGSYNAAIVGGSYALTPKKAKDIYSYALKLDPKYFKATEQLLEQPKDDRSLTISYDYQEVSGKIAPSLIKIFAKTKDGHNQVDLDFKNFEFGRKVNLPYKIPKGYTKIEI